MFSNVKTEKREMARRIRREEGASINEISRRTGAAESSISRWVRDIQLTPEQRETLRIAAYNGHVKGRTMHAQLRREARKMAQEEGRMRAQQGDAFFAAGCMLYWAEGSKQRNKAEFTNSDPEIVRFFVRFLKTYWNLGDDEIRVTCNLFADHIVRQRAIEQFWLDVAQLPRKSLRKSTVNVYSKYSKKKRTNRLPYGTCRVTVARTRVVQAIYGAIQEIGGFTRDAWLE
jgi:transposase-like protein